MIYFYSTCVVKIEIKPLTIIFLLLLQYSLGLSTPEGYQGYGPEQGQKVINLVHQTIYSAVN
jgi:hypothetical protein